jgi:glyoxylase-like metal-dependent hydrolase (beta-lactamase superfamily II)
MTQAMAGPINHLAAGLSYADLHFRGHPHIIASVIIHGAGEVAVLDPGPASTLPALRARLASLGLSVRDIRTILLTHIHLDHAGVTGALLREQPGLRVYVHERGARHMVDPSRLVASATMLWGDATRELWGEMLPVEESALVILRGGERVAAGGRSFEVAYTPGHASHHVSYFDRESGVAFVGDTAGVRVVSDGLIMPPTPPPDIDMPLWQASLTTIEQWRPSTLFLTHFGPATAIGAHLSSLRENMEWTVRLCRKSLAMPGEDGDRETWFVEQVRTELRRRVGESAAIDYEVSARLDLNWRGLARFLRKS